MKKNAKTLYLVLRIIVILISIAAILRAILTDDESLRSQYIVDATQAFGFMIASFLPQFLKKFHFEIPNALIIIWIFFMAAHFVLGEILNFYAYVKGWDTILHTCSGVVLGIVAYSILDLLNGSDYTSTRLTPLFTALFAVTFTVTVGVIWEFAEWTIDGLTGSNMQRFRESLAPFTDYAGRAALRDTMKDLLNDLIGGSIAGIIGILSCKKNKDVRPFEHWLIRWNKDEPASAQASAPAIAPVANVTAQENDHEPQEKQSE